MPVGAKKRKMQNAQGRGFFFPQPLRWYSVLPVGMFYAGRAIALKIIFPIDMIF
jgi:hypothetical protein